MKKIPLESFVRWSHILQRGQAHSGSKRLRANRPHVTEPACNQGSGERSSATISTLLGSTASYGDGDVPGGKLGGRRNSVMASRETFSSGGAVGGNELSGAASVFTFPVELQFLFPSNQRAFFQTRIHAG